MQTLSRHFNVEKVPTLLTVFRGSVLDVHVGSMCDDGMHEFLSKVSNATSSTMETQPDEAPRKSPVAAHS
jgi:hypothetical protein